MTQDDYDTAAAWQAQAEREQDAAMDDEFAEEREMDKADKQAADREAWLDDEFGDDDEDAHFEDEQP